MPRKCTVCAHASKAEIDKRIIAGSESALSIARLFGISKDSVARHRSHLKSAIRNAQVIKSTGFQELTKAVERLIAKVEKHLSISAKSETWFKESRELRNWIGLRAKLAGKLVIDEGKQQSRGDTYCVSFIGPDRLPVRIPLRVYASLPAECSSRMARNRVNSIRKTVTG